MTMTAQPLNAAPTVISRFRDASAGLYARGTVWALGLGTTLATTAGATAPVDIDAFNRDFGTALGKGTEAAKKVSCTGFLAFLGGNTAKFIFAAVLVVLAIAAFISYMSDRRQGGTGISRPFWFIIIFFIFTAIAGTLLTTYMGCNTRAASTGATP